MGVKVRERKPGEWWLFIDHNGQRKAVKVGSKSAAKTKATELEGMLVNGKLNLNPPETPAPVQFKKYAKNWMDGYVENNLKWNTKRYYADMIQKIPDTLQQRSLEEITREDVRALAFDVLSRGLSRSTVVGLLRTISAIYNAAAEDGIYRGSNPAARPGRILRVDNGADAVKDEETDCMNQKDAGHFLAVSLAHFGKSYPIFLTALRTGGRQGELIGLTWDAIDWNGGFVTIKQTIVNGKPQGTKNRQLRRVPMSPQLISTLRDIHRMQSTEALAAGKGIGSWIFQNDTGGPVDPSRLRKVFSAVLRKAGIRALTFQSLRRTALTTMAEKGMPMAMLQRIAGHSSIEVTARYYLRVHPEGQQEVLHALDAMDGKKSATPAQPSPLRAESPEGAEACIRLN